MNNQCQVEGCEHPRKVSRKGKLLPKCEAHMREQWRADQSKQRDRSNPDRTRRQRSETAREPKPARRPRQVEIVCTLCHRTPAQAAMSALHHVYCAACTPLGTTRAKLNKRLTPASHAASQILLVDYTTNQVEFVAGTCEEKLPMPTTERQLRDLIAEAGERGYTAVQYPVFRSALP